MLGEWLSRIRFLFAGKSRAEVDEEIQFHIERQFEANIASGMSRAEARRQAVLRFGGREVTRERCREQRPSWTVESLGRDARYGVRGLLRNPGFALVAVATLGLAIGANSTIFSLLNQALLRALPVQDPDQLVLLSFAGDSPGHHHSEGGNSPGHQHEFTYPMYKDLRDRNTVLSGLIASVSAGVGVVWNNHAEPVSAEVVTGNYFETLGVRPAVGRLFVASDETAEGANPVAVLNFDYWKSHLAEAQVEGKTLLINGAPFTIVGVAPPGFHSMVWGRLPAVYLPITMVHTVDPAWKSDDRKAYWIDLLGRLRPGVTRARAEASMNQLYIALRRTEVPLLVDPTQKDLEAFIDKAHLNLEAGANGFSPFRQDARLPLTIMMAMALLVVAMAVVNVASLLLVRAAMRVREFSMRFALGATSGQILRQLLTEGLLLGICGAALGLVLAPQALHLLIRWMSGATENSTPFSASLDWRVLLFTIAATLAASLLFSLAPAVQFWNPRLASALRQQGASGRAGSLRFRRTCVALQIGFSLLLIVGAGLFVRTIQNLHNVDPGFATDHVLAFTLDPQMAGYTPSAVTPVELRVVDSLAALPGVRGVAATNDADLQGDDREGDVVVDQDCNHPRPEEKEFDIELPWVSNGYLQTLGVPLVAGRYFNAADTATSRKVAIVNESFVRHYFGGNAVSAIGHRVCRPHRPTTDSVIVGVVKDVKHTSMRDPAIATSYTLFTQEERSAGLWFYVRTWQPPQSAVSSIRAAVAAIDTKLIVGRVNTLNDQIDDNLLSERTIALLAATFGGLATLLAGIGLYGILAYTTAQRTREIGIRMALGARRASVVGLILREVLVLAGGAVGITIPVAVLATRAVRSQLFGVSVADPQVYAAGVLLIAVVATIAGLLPSRRAACVDPARALRTE